MFWKRFKNIIKIKLQDFANRESDSVKGRSYKHENKSRQHAEPTSTSQESKYFKLLEMKPTNDLDAIKSQYRKLIRKYHPDKHDLDDDKREAARKLSIALNEAWDYFEKKLAT